MKVLTKLECRAELVVDTCANMTETLLTLLAPYVTTIYLSAMDWLMFWKIGRSENRLDHFQAFTKCPNLRSVVLDEWDQESKQVKSWRRRGWNIHNVLNVEDLRQLVRLQLPVTTIHISRLNTYCRGMESYLPVLLQMEYCLREIVVDKRLSTYCIKKLGNVPFLRRIVICKEVEPEDIWMFRGISVYFE